MCKVLVPPRYRSLSTIHEFTEKDHKVEVRKLNTKIMDQDTLRYLWPPLRANWIRAIRKFHIRHILRTIYSKVIVISDR